MKKIVDATNRLMTKAYIKAQGVITNVDGSETTEKIGMVVVAVMIVGLLTTAMINFMPDLFSSIGTTAREKLMSIFNNSTYS